ncbi:MAG: DUF948 domain-containing protein [Streptococcaceae bacterium]|nr:DUF948 domain-containing protein [Streptococcaceae bacterium]
MNNINLPWLIIAIAFAVLVIFLVVVLVQMARTLNQVARSVKLLSSDVDLLLHQADGIMTKANTLLDDVNGKVATIDPLFTAVADLSESISAVNNTGRNFAGRFSRSNKNKSMFRTASTVMMAKNAGKYLKKNKKKESK